MNTILLCFNKKKDNNKVLIKYIYLFVFPLNVMLFFLYPFALFNSDDITWTHRSITSSSH